jgi:hypothetical protein
VSELLSSEFAESMSCRLRRWADRVTPKGYGHRSQQTLIHR